MYAIVIRNNVTGEMRRIPQDHEWEEHTAFWWTEGNMGCDCNRHLVWVRSEPGPRPADDPHLNTVEAACGDTHYTVVRAEFDDGTNVILDDPKPGRYHFDLIAHLGRQFTFNLKTFGPLNRTVGIVEHIRKELDEILADPSDISEWIDVIILAMDGCRVNGYQPEQVARALMEKQLKNEARTWPDWRTAGTDKAIEHDRSKDS